MRRGLIAMVVSLSCVAVLACAAEKDEIRKYKFEINRVPFKSTASINPFRPQVPLKATERTSGDNQCKVRISTLKLSSVIVGRRKVAIFKEVHGPGYAYILVDGVLRGPDHNAIPGIEGKIEPLGDRGEFHVTLKQGIETIEFDHVIQRLREESDDKSAEQEVISEQAAHGTKKGGY
jgi:hypothetical protein